MDKGQLLRQHFGYASFLEGQESLIDHILSGQDVVGIMPTGAGKSLCFQIPALIGAMSHCWDIVAKARRIA